MVDALDLYGDEGRSKWTISFGEPTNGFDPEISEWGNSSWVIPRNHSFMRGAHRGKWNLSVPRGK